MSTHLLTRGLVVSTLFTALAAGCGGGGDDGTGEAPKAPNPDPQRCDVTALATPRLRLLTRREYNQTVHDWLGAWVGREPAGTACTEDTDCNVTEESCVGGTCQVDPCGLVTFVFPAAGQSYGTVHVAGSFNGWPGTVGEGGWAMTYVPSLDSWISKRTVDEGEHLYKFVLDESTWVADPTNPNGEPDGFGGQNSQLSSICDGPSPGGKATIPAEPAATFPVESRPEHYPFDNAASQIATSVHVEQYMRAGAEIALAVTADLSWLPCSEHDDACARTIARELGQGAFRRPLSDEEVARYAALVTAQPDWADGVRVALRVMLSSPYFLYRFEVGEPQADGTTRLDAYEVASLLSYSFWGTMPDDALMTAAAEGTLDSPEGVAAEARRLLDDPRARSVLARFAQQWLGVERALTATKNPNLYPDFHPTLASAMVAETGRFFTEVVYEGSGRFDELLLSDRSYADGALASLYGVDDDGMLPASRRAGFLGHASVLTSYALPDQTSPILRGRFVRERLLCQTLPTPPAQIPQLPEVSEDATTRERFAQHSSDPVCASCHQYIDGIGFAFEGFDAIGARRDQEAGRPIDERGDTVDLELTGDAAMTPFEGLPGLAQTLVASPSAQACFVKQTYRYAFGALEDEGHACEVAALEEAFAKGDRDIRGLLVALTQLERFTVRRPVEEEK